MSEPFVVSVLEQSFETPIGQIVYHTFLLDDGSAVSGVELAVAPGQRWTARYGGVMGAQLAVQFT